MTDLSDVISSYITEALSKTHTATVGRVVRVNATTIDVQPVINLIYNGEDITPPVFAEVPPVFLNGGASFTAYPVAVGDYALMIFTERSFDRWWSGTDGARPPELRMHNYSDGFAIIGIKPQASSIQIPSVITQVGDTHQTGDYVHIGNRTQTGNFELTGDMIINGNLTVNGAITTQTASIGGIDFGSHVHAQQPDSAGDQQVNTEPPQ